MTRNLAAIEKSETRNESCGGFAWPSALDRHRNRLSAEERHLLISEEIEKISEEKWRKRKSGARGICGGIINLPTVLQMRTAGLKSYRRRPCREAARQAIRMAVKCGLGLGGWPAILKPSRRG